MSKREELIREYCRQVNESLHFIQKYRIDPGLSAGGGTTVRRGGALEDPHYGPKTLL